MRVAEQEQVPGEAEQGGGVELRELVERHGRHTGDLGEYLDLRLGDSCCRLCNRRWNVVQCGGTGIRLGLHVPARMRPAQDYVRGSLSLALS